MQAVRTQRIEEEWPNLPGRKRRKEKKVFRKTEPFIHLTYRERRQVIEDALDIVGRYRRGVTLFAEAIEKEHLPPGVDPIDQSFTQVVTRFELFLRRRKQKQWGILAIDHDEHKSRRLADMLRRFQREGTRWRGIERVIEAPFFFESEASAGVQVTDLCAYVLRRYLENREEEWFQTIFPKFDRTPTGLHGLRHYTRRGCDCLICRERGHDKVS